MWGSDPHLAHRCPLTHEIRDRELVPPSEFFLHHCGKVYATCKDKCYIFKKTNDKMVDLTCGIKDQGIHHFLLCDKETCRKKCEAYWHCRKSWHEIVYLVNVEDADYSDLNDLDQFIDEMDDKIDCSNIHVVQHLFIPIMLVFLQANP